MKTTCFNLLASMALLSLFRTLKAEDYHHYFPLHPKNNWQYRFEQTETIYALPDSVFEPVHVDGKTYVTWGDNKTVPIFIRQDESGRIFRRLPMGEKLWFDFSKKHGESYTWSTGADDAEFVVTVKKNVRVMTYAGPFENCIEFQFNVPAARDEEFTYVFAPNVGIVKKQFSRMNMLLVTAQIDRQFITRVKSTKPNIVSGFVLSQNYPNPFNPATFIRFAVPQDTFVSLEIFDIRGVKVRTLVSGIQIPGEYIARWDGTDDAGYSLSSGIYNYRLATDAFVDVKRMLLLR